MKGIGLRAATHYQVDLPGGPFQSYLSDQTRPDRRNSSAVPVRST
jgi:hypothetical protein